MNVRRLNPDVGISLFLVMTASAAGWERRAPAPRRFNQNDEY
jgi:hypothetical protein